MSEQELYGQMEINRPYLHCHHKPEEKPCWKCMEEMRIGGKCPHVLKEKPKCWCGIHSHFIGDYALHENEKLILIFCPQCGRKLTEEPMVAPEDLRGEIDVHPKRGNF